MRGSRAAARGLAEQADARVRKPKVLEEAHVAASRRLVVALRALLLAQAPGDGPVALERRAVEARGTRVAVQAAHASPRRRGCRFARARLAAAAEGGVTGGARGGIEASLGAGVAHVRRPVEQHFLGFVLEARDGKRPVVARKARLVLGARRRRAEHERAAALWSQMRTLVAERYSDECSTWLQ